MKRSRRIRARARARIQATFEIIALAETLQTLNGFGPDFRTVFECEYNAPAGARL
jgi:hypothetical protein